MLYQCCLIDYALDHPVRLELTDIEFNGQKWLSVWLTLCFYSSGCRNVFWFPYAVPPDAYRRLRIEVKYLGKDRMALGLTVFLVRCTSGDLNRQTGED